MPFVPVRRLLALTIGGFAALLGVGLIMGAQTTGVAQRLPFAIVVFGAQVLYVLATSMALRPPNGQLVAGVSIISALVAGYLVTVASTSDLGRLGLVGLVAIAVGAIGQLLWREGRVRLTESFGLTAVVVIGTLAYTMLLVLVRIPLGTQMVSVCFAACGVALSIARLTDVVLPWPRMAPSVPRGALGIVLGTMIGTLVAAYIGKYLLGFTPKTAAIAGAVAAAIATVTDLTIGFAEAGQESEDDAPTMWIARHMQGPLAGFALAAPAAYLLNVIFWTGS